MSTLQAQAVAELCVDEVLDALHPSFASDVDPAATISQTLLVTGLAASPGAASGLAAIGSHAALDLVAAGNQVILVATETTPADVAAMGLSAGILTAHGGLASHAAVVARGWGIPAVCDAREVTVETGGFWVGDVHIANGTPISLDGSTGEVMLGGREVTSAAPDELLSTEISEVLGWADRIAAGRLAVLANADTAADASTARGLGAQGVGLCRTEHMFLESERLEIVQRAILSGEDMSRAHADLDELIAAQRDDFEALLEAMDGLCVTVRLLDAPMHEFLAGAADAGAAQQWREHNPMLGVRGVRLGLLRPEIYAAQVRALAGAVCDRLAAGGDPRAEIMVPLVSTASELTAAAAAVRSAWTETLEAVDLPGAPTAAGSPRIGTMIETPRACLVADRLASTAEFVSFGTNDLTQLAFGFSRDDVQSRVIEPYVARGLLESDPFATIDRDGVGELIATTLRRAKSVRPELRSGICGEHGGDPESISFAVAAGLDYVSCSPYRVPVARLAAAQAVLRGEAALRGE